MSETYFKETQRFKQWWIIIILIAIFGIWIWGIIQQIIFEIPFGNRPVSNLGLILIGIIALLPLILVFSFKMVTEIRDNGIYYRLFPITRFKKIKPDEIKEWTVAEYNPVKEFGGWGLRFSFRKKGGKAINMAGKMGLRIILTSGKKILIGTQNPEGIKEAMKKLIS